MLISDSMKTKVPVTFLIDYHVSDAILSNQTAQKIPAGTVANVVGIIGDLQSPMYTVELADGTLIFNVAETDIDLIIDV